jgi:glycosyltransferase 2 family protein
MMKKYKSAISFIITALLFVFLLKDVDFILFFQYLGEGDPRLAAIAVAVYLSAFVIRGLRWKVLTSHIGSFKTSELTMLTISGYAVNNIMPVRIGEFARAWITGKTKNVSRTSVLASIFVERVFDGLTIAAILFMMIFLYPFPRNIKTLGLMAFGFFFLLFIFIMIGTFSDKPLELLKYIRKKIPVSGFLIDVAEKFLKGASSIKSVKTFVIVTLLSFSIWAVELAVYVMVTRAFNVDIPVEGYLLMLCAANLGMLAAPTPGGLAVFQAAIVYSLKFFSILYEKRMAVAIVLHMSQIIPVTIIGVIWLWYNHITISMIENEGKKDNCGNKDGGEI